MYQPPLFREDRLEVQHALIRSHPFGLLISAGAGGLMANAVPFVLDAAVSEKGTLRAHVARANPHWQEFTGDGCDSLVVFQGPQAYVTPSWYPTKGQTGKVVPTWNYAMVQVRGRCVAHEDATWLRPQVEALTNGHEARRAVPWAVSDAPEDFVAMQLRAIVGIEIEIAAIEGKWKVSQNRNEADKRGVHAGFVGEGEAQSAMAQLVAARGGLAGGGGG
jgi:transcriptional regulator